MTSTLSSAEPLREAPPTSTWRAVRALIARDLKLAARRRSEVLLPLVFFVAAASLFPLGVGADPLVLRQIAPGVIWVCALLAVTLSVNTFYAADHADGTLEQMILSGRSMTLLATARALAHWLLSGLPMILIAPLLGLMYSLPLSAIGTLVLGLLLGTPTLGLLGNLGAALVVGVRGGGMLLFLIVLPLAIPVLIFGAGAMVADQSGLGAGPYFSLLGALLIGACLLLPWAIGVGLKIAVE